MSLKTGIVGLPYIGKTTIFRALTSLHAAAEASRSGVDPNVGVVAVPDERLHTINKYIETDKIVPATLHVVDIPGLSRGSSEGQGRGNKFLAHIREVDALIHVVRCFQSDDVPHPDGSLDPNRDIDTVDLELAVADLEMVSNSLDRAEKLARTRDKEAVARVELLKRIKPHLDEGRPLRQLEFSAEERKITRTYGFLTLKRVLYVANVDETDLEGKGPLVMKVRERAAQEGAGAVAICGKLESELNELEEKDRGEMLASMGLKATALASVCQEAYKVLGLCSYFTAGEMEIKAWTIPIGALGPQAAGVIHSDFERGYIRSEVYTVADLEKYHTETAIRQAGKLRVEGKNYVVQDGDICHFLFNV